MAIKIRQYLVWYKLRARKFILMDSIGNRLKFLRGKQSGEEFSKLLDTHPQTIYRYERGERKPDLDFVQLVVKKTGVCIEWLITGEGPVYPCEQNKTEKLVELRKSIAAITEPKDDFITIPMAKAVLSAGSGSLETSGECERGYAFRRDFIERKGNYRDMILMRVYGDSMEPEIMDNDIVLLDQSKRTVLPGRIFAVGFEDAIYLKRIDMLPGKVVLKSINPMYPPVELDIRGQMSDLFRVIGRVLWCGREYK